MSKISNRVSVLGLGAMGTALATALVHADHHVTVWNRTPGKEAELTAAGARSVPTVVEAMDAELVIVCLLDHASVMDTVDTTPVPSGTALINMTSTTPNESRSLAEWARGREIPFLDGGIMATPAMIGTEAGNIIYSGDNAVFEAHRALLETFGTADYLGADAGTAATVDFALLAAMYTMFGGFQHGAALASTAGMSASAFAERAHALLGALLGTLFDEGREIDAGRHTDPAQNLAFTKKAVDAIVRAGRDAGIDNAYLEPTRTLIDRAVAGGGRELGSSALYELIRHP